MAESGSDDVQEVLEGNENYGSSLERELVNPHKLTLRDFRASFCSIFSKFTEYSYHSREENTGQILELRTLFWNLRNNGGQIQLSRKNFKLYEELQSKQVGVYKFLLKIRHQNGHMDGIAHSVCYSRKAKRLERHLSHAGALLLAEQFSSDEKLKRTKKSWTTAEKIKALYINKKSPKLYLMLEKISVLPPRYMLRDLMNSFDISTGISNIMFHCLAKRVNQFKKAKDKFCFLTFDELTLDPGVFHQRGPDKIVGFEDLGIHGQSKMPANYALVFSLRGLRGNWFQPVAFYLCYKSTPVVILRRILAEVIEAVFEIGLNILAIICVPTSEDRSALQSYVCAESSGPFVNIGGRKITVLYDPPTLLKMFRDCFRSHDIHFEGKVAKWRHIEILHRLEEHEELNLVQKLTKNHLEPDGPKRNRMDLVKEVISHSVAAAIYYYASADAPRSIPMPWEAGGTAMLLAMMDNLYDSFSRELRYPKERKKMYSILTDSSGHEALWNEALEFIREWRVVEPQSFKVVRPIVQDGWINNMEGCLRIKEVLAAEGIGSFPLRGLSVDPMRKLFSALKRPNGKWPSCAQFQFNLKTYLLNEQVYQFRSNLSKECHLLADIRHSSGIDGKGKKTHETKNSEIPEMDSLWAWEEPQLAYFESQSVVWVSAFVANLAVRKFPRCKKCHHCLVFDVDASEHFVIGEQALHLSQPTDELCALVGSTAQFCDRVLPNILYEKGVVAKLTKVGSERLDWYWLRGCSSHANEMSRYLLTILFKIYVHHFCKKYNRRAKNPE